MEEMRHHMHPPLILGLTQPYSHLLGPIHIGLSTSNQIYTLGELLMYSLNGKMESIGRLNSQPSQTLQPPAM